MPDHDISNAILGSLTTLIFEYNLITLNVLLLLTNYILIFIPVFPSLSLRFKFAPFCMSKLAMVLFPVSAAKIRALSPFLFCALTFTPGCKINIMIVVIEPEII